MTSDHFQFREPVYCFVSKANRKWQFPLPCLTDLQRNELHRHRLLVIALPEGYKHDGLSPIDVLKTDEPVILTTRRTGSSIKAPIFLLSIDTGKSQPEAPTLALLPPTPQPNKRLSAASISSEASTVQGGLSGLFSRARDILATPQPGTASATSSPSTEFAPPSPITPAISVTSTDGLELPQQGTETDQKRKSQSQWWSWGSKA